MAQIDFETLLKKTMGLDSTSVGSATIDNAVQLRMSSLGFKRTADYWEKLLGSEEELQELIEAVVVPETWFFRDPDAFTTLVRLVSEEWLPHSHSGPLRLLSVPCCTGEEPYSMVMALLNDGLPQERLKVDAVDISVRALVRARRGVYGSNSFRGDNLVFRDRHFQQVPNGYSLAERLRSAVTFHHGNLLASDFQAGSAAYDVIFCRNVLIYFDRTTQEQVMKVLWRLLTPSGFLFVGPSEAFLAASSGFKSINHSMSFAFRKNTVSTPEVAIARPREVPIRNIQRQTVLPAPRTRDPAPPPAPPAVTAISSAMDLERAKHLGDIGKFGEAVALCEMHLKQRGPSAEAYHLLGLVRDAMGDLHHAAECYRKVLYLEPNHREALLHLAFLSDKLGDTINAERLRERARRAAKDART